MAKTQTFQNKSNKKGSDSISVKIVVTDKTQKGTYKFTEKFIKVKEMADVDKVMKA